MMKELLKPLYILSENVHKYALVYLVVMRGTYTISTEIMLSKRGIILSKRGIILSNWKLYYLIGKYTI